MSEKKSIITLLVVFTSCHIQDNAVVWLEIKSAMSRLACEISSSLTLPVPLCFFIIPSVFSVFVNYFFSRFPSSQK